MPPEISQGKYIRNVPFVFSYSRPVAAHVIPPTLPSLGEESKFKMQAALSFPQAPTPRDLQPSASTSRLKLEVPGVHS